MRSAWPLLLAFAACSPAEQREAALPSDAPAIVRPPPAPHPSPAPTSAVVRTSDPKARSWPHYQALGTEPFWNIEVLPGQLRFTTPENGGVDLDASRSRDGAADVYTGRLWAFPFILRIEPGECSDGMSDTVYPFTATLTAVESTRAGCARVAAR